MALFRIHRIKESAQQNFRWAPHTTGVTAAKPRDYEQAGMVEAAGLYQAWHQVRETPEALQLGDILESVDTGDMRICKYVGFEEAKWVVPELKLHGEPPQTVDGSAQFAKAASTM